MSMTAEELRFYASKVIRQFTQDVSYPFVDDVLDEYNAEPYTHDDILAIINLVKNADIAIRFREEG